MLGRDQNKVTSTTDIEFLPGTDEVRAVASGEVGGTWICEGAALYSYQ